MQVCFVVGFVFVVYLRIFRTRLGMPFDEADLTTWELFGVMASTWSAGLFARVC